MALYKNYAQPRVLAFECSRFFARADVQYNRFITIADVTVKPRRSALRLTAVANAAVTSLRDVKEKLSHQRCECQ